MSDAAMSVTPILIVGAGPVGLSLAGDLGWRGVSSIVVEQSDGSIEQPRMDLVGIRTMEFCRRWGITENVYNCPYPQDYGQDFVFVTSVVGHEMARQVRPTRREAKPPAFSPQRRERCPQNMFDPILRDFATSFDGTDLRYHTRLVSFAEDDDGVVADTENTVTGETEEIHARYLIGCDGAGSTVRKGISAEMRGQPVLTYSMNVLFRCPDFNTLHEKGEAYRFILVGPDGVWATMVAIDGRDTWRFQYVGGPEAIDHDEEDVRRLIFKAVGREFEFEVLSIMPWTRRQLVADPYRRGRVFLVGDAAHEMSPTGGFGMNTGIGDATDLSWKLCGAIEGWGGETLLDSYGIERSAVAQRNVDEAANNLSRMVGTVKEPTLLDDTEEAEAKRRELGDLLSKAMDREYRADGIHVGYRYEGSPVIASEDSPIPPNDPVDYIQMARPGARAPHVWLDNGRSTLDLFGRRFVLLVFDPKAETAALEKAAKACGLPFETVRIDSAEAKALYQKKLVLVRPDGHVAWRGNTIPNSPEKLVDQVRGIALPSGT